ncbi:hypothetical protein AGLY_010421 [Aphis glycines]|uniref:Uncharacterized protein n=1 Tax=Aphis glycines TaxID=307491 RepID=A0A6G0TDP6_APHGL|nr:hypothetical protein AGLY_010421 [Aphis glycines]
MNRNNITRERLKSTLEIQMGTYTFCKHNDLRLTRISVGYSKGVFARISRAGMSVGWIQLNWEYEVVMAMVAFSDSILSCEKNTAGLHANKHYNCKYTYGILGPLLLLLLLLLMLFIISAQPISFSNVMRTCLNFHQMDSVECKRPMMYIKKIKFWKSSKQNPYLDEVSLKFPPSSKRTLANNTALTKGTAVKSSRQRLTVNLYRFFFTMNDILRKIKKIKNFYLTTDDVRFCDYSKDIGYTHTFTGTYHMQHPNGKVDVAVGAKQ